MSLRADVQGLTQELIPTLRFAVQDAASVDHAAVPTLEFALRIESGEIPIRSIMLDTQIQIAARQRDYAGDSLDALEELFGTRDRWGSTLRTLPWTRTTMIVPAFTGATVAHLTVACTYDLEVTASRYFAALRDGEVPLEFLFSGSVFFTTSAGALQTTRIGWDQDVSFMMPVSVWRRMIDHHFPQSAWLRLGREPFERLTAYKARHALRSWDAALDALLDRAEAEEGRRAARDA
jgi:hypothetical protein